MSNHCIFKLSHANLHGNYACLTPPLNTAHQDLSKMSSLDPVSFSGTEMWPTVEINGYLQKSDANLHGILHV